MIWPQISADLTTPGRSKGNRSGNDAQRRRRERERERKRILRKREERESDRGKEGESTALSCGLELVQPAGL